MEIDTRVKWSKKFIKNWILSEDNAAAHEFAGAMDTYNAIEYEQEILLALFTLMGEPVWGIVKGPGCNADTVLVFMYHDGCSNWQYCNVKDLVKV